MVLLALLPSPLLGGGVWEPVASVLDGLGWRAEVVRVGGPAPASAQQALDGYLNALSQDEQLVLIPHSNAGMYVPALTEQRNVAAVVFVDAGVPPIDGGDVPTLPTEFYELIARKADQQRMLPVWTEWWDEQDLQLLLQDPRVRATVQGQQRRLPLSYFEDVLAVRRGWADRPCAYLGFGEGYATEAAKGRLAGWPVRVLDGEHLEMIVHPHAVGDAVLGLLREATRANRPQQ